MGKSQMVITQSTFRVISQILQLWRAENASFLLTLSAAVFSEGSWYLMAQNLRLKINVLTCQLKQPSLCCFYHHAHIQCIKSDTVPTQFTMCRMSQSLQMLEKGLWLLSSWTSKSTDAKGSNRGYNVTVNLSIDGQFQTAEQQAVP